MGNWSVRSTASRVGFLIFTIVQVLAYSAILLHLGRFGTAPIYFTFTQVWHGQSAPQWLWWLFHTHSFPNVKGRWDSLFSEDIRHGGFIRLMSPVQWRSGRHGVRYNWEGSIAGIFAAILVGFNAIKYQAKTVAKLAAHGPSTFSRITRWIPGFSSRYRRVTVLDQIGFWALVLILSMAVAIPMNLWVAPWLAQALHSGWINPTLSAHPTIAQKLYTFSWANVISGLIVGFSSKFFGRPVLNKYAQAIAHIYVAIGGRVTNWLPKNPRKLVSQIIQTHGGRSGARRSLITRESVGVLIGLVVFFALVGWGVYIFLFIA